MTCKVWESGGVRGESDMLGYTAGLRMKCEYCDCGDMVKLFVLQVMRQTESIMYTSPSPVSTRGTPRTTTNVWQDITPTTD